MKNTLYTVKFVVNQSESVVVCPFVLYLLVIVLSVLLRYRDSEYPFDIFKIFMQLTKTLQG